VITEWQFLPLLKIGNEEMGMSDFGFLDAFTLVEEKINAQI